MSNYKKTIGVYDKVNLKADVLRKAINGTGLVYSIFGDEEGQRFELTADGFLKVDEKRVPLGITLVDFLMESQMVDEKPVVYLTGLSFLDFNLVEVCDLDQVPSVLSTNDVEIGVYVQKPEKKVDLSSGMYLPEMDRNADNHQRMMCDPGVVKALARRGM